LALLPVSLVAGRSIYFEAWFLLYFGIACQLVPVLERHPAALRRIMIVSFPGLVAMVCAMAGFIGAVDWLKKHRESGRPLPRAGAPNVLLIVLDTVRADRLSLYRYERPTTPALERWARKGILFSEARATAPWTLASHASLFTGRLPHELDVKWVTPLRTTVPTLAEYFGSLGYATAGFVANVVYCSYDTGLDRGFSHYEDYVLFRLLPLRTACLFDQAVKVVSALCKLIDARPFRTVQAVIERSFFASDRKDAGAINREFLDWLSHRPKPARPFFVFLNYLDAHSPYVLTPGAEHRFGLKPQSANDLQVVNDHWYSIDKLQLSPRVRALVRDSYDNCIAHLDAGLGELFDELQRRGVLDQTLVIVTSDHGEGLGEHDLFDHGESLYRTELRVPLVIVPPAAARVRATVGQTVSLRDLPATIVELAGQSAGSPFPGSTLSPLWNDTATAADSVAGQSVVSELGAPNPHNPNQGRSPAHRGPLVAIADREFVYIQNTGDGTEELYNHRDDPHERDNRARVPSYRPLMEQFRTRLGQWRVNRP
jgi:arylsulfatase A-like enzyme